MFHHPQYWANRVPMSPFEKTQFDADQLFYATFPAARDAAYNAPMEHSIYDFPRPVDCPTLHEATQPLEYDIRSELDISSTSVASFRGPTQELSYPPLHVAYSEGHHPQQSFISHRQNQPSYYSSPPRPIKSEDPVYIPPKPLYRHQYSSEPTSQYIRQSHPSPVPAQEQSFMVYQPSPQVDTDMRGMTTTTTSSSHVVRPETPRYGFRQLNRHMKPSTLKFTNNCQLGVMRLNRLSLSDHDHIESPEHVGQAYPCSSEPSPPAATAHDHDHDHDSEESTARSPAATEFLLNSAPSPSIGLSSLPSKNTLEKKPPLACLFCRGRKIACGAPLPGSLKKTCNQCRKRGLTCYYPTESRRGMRKKKPPSDESEPAKETLTKIKRKRKN